MRRGTQVFHHVGVEQTNIDIVDAEHLRVANKNGLEAGRKQRCLVRWLRQRVDVMDLTGGRHDDHLCLDTILVDLTLDILHDLTEQVFELQKLDLTGALAEADIAGAHILVHSVDEGAHQDEDVGVFLAHAGHELLQSVVQEVTFRGEWARCDHALDRLLLLELIETLELGKVAEGLGWPHCKLVQAIHIEFRVGVVEAFCDDHFALEDRVLGHFVQVEFNAIL